MVLAVLWGYKKVYVLQLSNSSSARKFTIKYRTIVEDSSQVISYIAGVESKTGLPRNNWYAISGKYDKNLVSQVGAPSVTPNLTNTSINVPVQTVASTSSTLSGTGVPGATIKLYIDGQEQNIGNVTVDSSGNWTTGELPTALNNNQGEGTTIKPRQTVQVTQTVDGTESSRRTVPVSIGETTVEPSSLTSNQDAVVAGQKRLLLRFLMMQVLLTCAIQILQVKQLKFQSNVTVYQLHGCHKSQIRQLSNHMSKGSSKIRSSSQWLIRLQVQKYHLSQMW